MANKIINIKNTFWIIGEHKGGHWNLPFYHQISSKITWLVWKRWNERSQICSSARVTRQWHWNNWLQKMWRVIPGLPPWWDRGSQCQLENLWRDTQRTLMDYTNGESQWHSEKPPSKGHLNCRLHLPDRSMKRPHSAISGVTFSITSGRNLNTNKFSKTTTSWNKRCFFLSELTCCSCFNKFLSSTLTQLLC